MSMECVSYNIENSTNVQIGSNNVIITETSVGKDGFENGDSVKYVRRESNDKLLKQQQCNHQSVPFPVQESAFQSQSQHSNLNNAENDIQEGKDENVILTSVELSESLLGNQSGPQLSTHSNVTPASPTSVEKDAAVPTQQPNLAPTAQSSMQTYMVQSPMYHNSGQQFIVQMPAYQFPVQQLSSTNMTQLSTEQSTSAYMALPHHSSNPSLPSPQGNQVPMEPSLQHSILIPGSSSTAVPSMPISMLQSPLQYVQQVPVMLVPMATSGINQSSSMQQSVQTSDALSGHPSHQSMQSTSMNLPMHQPILTPPTQIPTQQSSSMTPTEAAPDAKKTPHMSNTKGSNEEVDETSADTFAGCETNLMSGENCADSMVFDSLNLDENFDENLSPRQSTHTTPGATKFPTYKSGSDVEISFSHTSALATSGSNQ